MKNYIAEIITTILLIASAVFLFFNGYYQPLMRYQNGVIKLSKYYEKQKIELEKSIQQQEKDKKTQKNTLNSVPKVLKAINDSS